MLTADPRVVPGAVPVPAVTYEEASELAYFGAKILHPISMQPAMKKNIPVRIKNSYNPEHPGRGLARASGDCPRRHRHRRVPYTSNQSLTPHVFLPLSSHLQAP